MCWLGRRAYQDSLGGARQISLVAECCWSLFYPFQVEFCAPLGAYINMLWLIPAEAYGPAFVLPVKDTLVPVTYQMLQNFIKKCVAKLGQDPRLLLPQFMMRRGLLGILFSGPRRTNSYTWRVVQSGLCKLPRVFSHRDMWSCSKVEHRDSQIGPLN